MMPVLVPEAVRICDRCGVLAAGDGCASCRETEAAAVRFAWRGVRQGATVIEIERRPDDSKRQKLFCELTESQFHCLRLAAFSDQLPCEAGLQPEPAMPGMFATWGALGRLVGISLVLIAVSALFVLLVLL